MSLGKRHKEIVEKLMYHPELLGEGIKLVYRETGVGRGRVDLLGVDREGNRIIVEVKSREPSFKQRLQQLPKYYAFLKRILELMRVERKIRVFLATPKGVRHLYDIKPSLEYRATERTGIPTSRELYGGKVDIKELLKRENI